MVAQNSALYLQSDGCLKAYQNVGQQYWRGKEQLLENFKWRGREKKREKKYKQNYQESVEWKETG